MSWHELTWTETQLMIYWKWLWIWINWRSHNCDLKTNGLYWSRELWQTLKVKINVKKREKNEKNTSNDKKGDSCVLMDPTKFCPFFITSCALMDPNQDFPLSKSEGSIKTHESPKTWRKSFSLFFRSFVINVIISRK